MSIRQGGIFWDIKSKLLFAVTSYGPLIKPSAKMTVCITERIVSHWTGYFKVKIWDVGSAKKRLLESMCCYIRDHSSRKELKQMGASFVSVKGRKAVQTTKRSRQNIWLYQSHSFSSHCVTTHPGHTLQPGHTCTSHMFARIRQKPEKWCKLPWLSKHDSSSGTFWEAPPAPNRKLKHPKTHLRTRSAPFNHQVLPITFSGNQVIQSHFTGWTIINFKWAGAFAPRPFPNLCCLLVSNSLLTSSLNIFFISHVSLYLQHHGPLRLGSFTPLTISLHTTGSHISFSSFQARINHPGCAHLLSSFLPQVQKSALLLFPSDVPNLKPRQGTKGTHARIYLKKQRALKKNIFSFTAEIIES